MEEFTKYKFDLNMATPCNFIYKRAINPNIDIRAVHYTEAQLQKYADYIENLIITAPDNKRKVAVTIYGVDFTEELTTLNKFIRTIHDYVDWFFLSMAPVGIQNYTDNLYQLYKACESKLRVDLECTPNELFTSSDSIYDSLLYNIRWLYGRRMGGYVKVSVSSIKSVPAIFDIFVRLFSVVPFVKFELMLDYTKAIDAECDKATLDALEAMKTALDNNSIFQQSFVYSSPQGVRMGQLPDAMFGNIMGVMADGGVIYPGYDISMITEKAVSDLSIGTTADEVSDIIKTRSVLLSSIPLNYDYTDLDNLYKSVPWEHSSDNVTYNMVASEQAKQLHILLTHYLSTRGV